MKPNFKLIVGFILILVAVYFIGDRMQPAAVLNLNVNTPQLHVDRQTKEVRYNLDIAPTNFFFPVNMGQPDCLRDGTAYRTSINCNVITDKLTTTGTFTEDGIYYRRLSDGTCYARPTKAYFDVHPLQEGTLSIAGLGSWSLASQNIIFSMTFTSAGYVDLICWRIQDGVTSARNIVTTGSLMIRHGPSSQPSPQPDPEPDPTPSPTQYKGSVTLT